MRAQRRQTRVLRLHVNAPSFHVAAIIVYDSLEDNFVVFVCLC